MSRYEVNSEQVRGERRIYWVFDTITRKTVEGTDTFDARTAERRRFHLNEQAERESERAAIR